MEGRRAELLLSALAQMLALHAEVLGAQSLDQRLLATGGDPCYGRFIWEKADELKTLSAWLQNGMP